jgi:hypothetical protein
MRKRAHILVAVLLLALTASYAWAHHAFSAEFDANKPVKLRGKVTKLDWINPHAWIYMDVAGANGKVDAWMVELGPPNALLKRGWTKNSVPPGTEILVDGYRAKDGALRANGRDVTLPDGKKLFAESSFAGAAGEKTEK